MAAPAKAHKTLSDIASLGRELEIIPANKFEVSTGSVEDSANSKLAEMRHAVNTAPAVVRLSIAGQMHIARSTKNFDDLAVLFYCLAAALPENCISQSAELLEISRESKADYVLGMIRFRNWWKNSPDGPIPQRKTELCSHLVTAYAQYINQAIANQYLPEDWPVNINVYRKYVPAWMSETALGVAAEYYINTFSRRSAEHTADSLRRQSSRTRSPLMPLVLRVLDQKFKAH